MSRLVLPRRRVLQGFSASVGLAACTSTPTGPPPARPTAAQRGKIDTIVICMMENRSFDHVFGSLSLLEGRQDVDGLTADHANPDLDGLLVPPTPLVEPCTEPDPPHGWTSSRTQFDAGTNDGFVRAFLEDNPGADPTLPMTFQDRAQQPVSYALADSGALCQRWFSSVLSSTWPNRIYFHAAQSQGIQGNDMPPEGAYTCRTLWDQLTDAGVDWGYYFTDLPTLGLFARGEYLAHMRGIEEFYADAAAGALPSVVCVDAGAGYNDDHPPHHPLLGQIFLGSVYNALAASPHWGSCLLMVTYDEAGGFFDHVPPGLIADDFAAQGFDQLGFRVPAFLAGPYVRPGVSDTAFEHASALRFIQDHFGIDERLTLRNEVTGDLSELLDTAALDAGTPAEPILLPPIPRSEAEIEAECERLGQRTGQPELQAAVRQWRASTDRTASLPEIARRTWRIAGEQGLWVPR